MAGNCKQDQPPIPGESDEVQPFLETLDRQFPNKGVFNIRQVRDLLGLKSTMTVYTWVQQGRFPSAFRTSHKGGIRILRNDLLEFYRRYRLKS